MSASNLASTPADARASLEDARRRLREEDVVGAFDALLAAWRAVRAEELAELCEALSRRVAAASTRGGAGGGTAGSHIGRLVAWTEAFRASTPLGLGALLEEFERAITEGAQARFVFPRADALSTVKDDPRVASSMLRALASVEGGSTWDKVILRCLRGIDASGDPRAIRPLTARVEELPAGSARARAAPKVLASLRARGEHALPGEVVELVRDLGAAIEALPEAVAQTGREAPPQRADDPQALFSAVWDDPDDDARRLVLADALSERGDPRGELIVLQIRRAQGDGNARALARERQLLKANLRAWLGPLASIVTLKSAVFERGFLDRCEVAVKNQTTARLHLEHPEWATVREIRFRGASFVGPTMRSLRELRGLDSQGLAQVLLRGHPSLERLEYKNLSATIQLARQVLADLAASDKLPALRHLALSAYATGILGDRPADFAWVMEAPWSKGLETLAVPCRGSAAAWVSVLARHPRLQEIRLEAEAGICATLTRREEGGRSAITLTLRREHVFELREVPWYLVRALDGAIRRFVGAEGLTELRVELETSAPLDDRQRALLLEATASLGRLDSVTLPFPWVDLPTG